MLVITTRGRGRGSLDGSMLVITTRGRGRGRGSLDGSMLVIYYMGVVHTAKEGGKSCKINTIAQTATQDRRTHYVAVTPARSCPGPRSMYAS